MEICQQQAGRQYHRATHIAQSQINPTQIPDRLDAACFPLTNHGYEITGLSRDRATGSARIEPDYICRCMYILFASLLWPVCIRVRDEARKMGREREESSRICVRSCSEDRLSPTPVSFSAALALWEGTLHANAFLVSEDERPAGWELV